MEANILSMLSPLSSYPFSVYKKIHITLFLHTITLHLMSLFSCRIETVFQKLVTISYALYTLVLFSSKVTNNLQHNVDSEPRG